VLQAKEESSGAPRMLKISLTDGSTTCHAVEISKCDKLSLSTPPGSKIRCAKKKDCGKRNIPSFFIF